MKEKIQQLPPAVVIAVAVIALGIAGFFGIRNFIPENSSGSRSTAAEMAAHKTNYTTNGRGSNNQQAGYAQRGGYGGGGGRPGYAGGQQPGGYGGGGQQPGGYGGGGQQPGGYGGGQQPGGYGGR